MAAISSEAKTAINTIIDEVVNKYISKAQSRPTGNSGNPFVMALLKGFEPLLHNIHGLKTSLGYEMEKIAAIIAKDAWGEGHVHRKVKEQVLLPVNVFNAIDSIVNDLRDVKTLSDYESEKRKIFMACENPSKEEASYLYEFDLIIESATRKHLYILEMKGPDPNTTEVPGAKRRLLTGLAWARHVKNYKGADARLCVYYNNKHPKPYNNPKVLSYFNPNGGIITQEAFWNFLGKSDEVFVELADLFETYGEFNKERIWNGFSQLVKQ